MKLHLITIGKPKLAYAKLGWDEYLLRLQRFHRVHVTQLADKYANDTAKLQTVTRGTFTVALEITGQPLSSHTLATFLTAHELAGQSLSFLVGGPDGLPAATRDQADFQWSLSPLTLPHDLAMIVTIEALYRASTINAGLPYHK